MGGTEYKPYIPSDEEIKILFEALASGNKLAWGNKINEIKQKLHDEVIKIDFSKFDKNLLANKSVNYFDFRDIAIDNLNLEKVEFNNCYFEGAKIEDCKFDNCRFSKNTFGVSPNNRHSFIGKSSEFQSCKFNGDRYTSAHIDGAKYLSCEFCNEIFETTDINNTDILNAKFLKGNPANNFYNCSFNECTRITISEPSKDNGYLNNITNNLYVTFVKSKLTSEQGLNITYASSSEDKSLQIAVVNASINPVKESGVLPPKNIIIKNINDKILFSDPTLNISHVCAPGVYNDDIPSVQKEEKEKRSLLPSIRLPKLQFNRNAYAAETDFNNMLSLTSHFNFNVQGGVAKNNSAIALNIPNVKAFIPVTNLNNYYNNISNLSVSFGGYNVDNPSSKGAITDVYGYGLTYKEKVSNLYLGLNYHQSFLKDNNDYPVLVANLGTALNSMDFSYLDNNNVLKQKSELIPSVQIGVATSLKNMLFIAEWNKYINTTNDFKKLPDSFKAEVGYNFTPDNGLVYLGAMISGYKEGITSDGMSIHNPKIIPGLSLRIGF